MSSSPLVRPELAAWVRSAGSLAAESDAIRMLPVVDALRPLLPGGGLRRGSTIVVARADRSAATGARGAGASQTPDRLRASAPAAAQDGSPSGSGQVSQHVPVVIADGLAPARSHHRSRPGPVGTADGVRPVGPSRASVPPAGATDGTASRETHPPQVRAVDGLHAQPSTARQLDRLENRSGGASLRAAASRAVAARSAPSQRWGATSIMLALLAEASRSGAWCAVVGLPELGVGAAAEMGIALDRLALVPDPGLKWTDVIAALIDGFDIVAMAVTSQLSARDASRLSARARQRGCVLIPVGSWDTPDLVLEPVQAVWQGLGPGHGRLKCRYLTVVAQGRGAAARPRQIDVWLPTAAGGISAVVEPDAPPGLRLRAVRG